MMMNCTPYHGDFHQDAQATSRQRTRLCVQIPDVAHDPAIEEFLAGKAGDYHSRLTPPVASGQASASAAPPPASPDGGYSSSLNVSGISIKSPPVAISPMSSPTLACIQEVPSILREALTKPQHQQSFSCPPPTTSMSEGGGEGDDVFPDEGARPKYNLDAIKNYPPFRDVYNAVRARSKSTGRGMRQRSSSESSSIKCSRCNQVLTSKCLVQRCYPLSEQTKCKACGRELTTRCLLSNCIKMEEDNEQ